LTRRYFVAVLPYCRTSQVWPINVGASWPLMLAVAQRPALAPPEAY